MNENIWIVLIVVAICSYLAVKAWVNARRAEREAFYRSESLKKMAEMHGTIPESVLEILREAVKQKEQPPSSLNYDYNREREAYYRSEMVKKIADTGGWAAAQEFLREDEKKVALRRKQAFKLGGVITLAAGMGFMIFLRAIEKGGEPVYLIGLMPVLVGIVMVAYAFITSPTNES